MVCRREVKRLRFAGQRRIHWRDERPERRDRIVGAIAALPWTAAVATHTPVPRRLETRARVDCLERIAAWLADEGVGTLVIESRGAHNDREDRGVLIERSRSGHRFERYGFARPADEPLLWIADVVAGVTSAHLAGISSRWFPPINGKVLILPNH